MCTLAFQGKGYSAPFVKNYQNIVKQLEDDPNTIIQVTDKLDTICQACPHQTLDKKCESQDFIDELDAAHQKILGLWTGQKITWAKAKEIIKSKMTLEKFHAACEGCEWKSFGMCEGALRALE